MGFREFISSFWYRRRMLAEFERFQNIRPPANPSQRYIDKLVHRLLDERKAWAARKELSMIGAAAVPSLAAALRDPRYQQAEWPDWSQVPAPLESVLELLVPHGADHVLAAALPLVESPSSEVRKTAAMQLASLGRVETIPALAKLLQDPDGYVRSYVANGIGHALAEGRGDAEFKRRAYELMLAQCDQTWAGTLNDAPDTVVALDPERDASDFAGGRWLSAENPNAHLILKACNDADIVLPDAVVRPLLEHSMPLAVGEGCYPHPYIVAAALEALCLATGEAVRPLLEASLGSDQREIREAAARGTARLAGVTGPAGFALDREKEVGFDGLTQPQRVVRCAFLFDAEVCNGGLLQFFGNSSGDRAAETLDALRALGHAEAETALAEAIRLVGPLALERDRELRLTAFEGRFEELERAFRPLEDAYYRTDGRLRQKMLLYAAEHAADFRR